MNVVMKFKLNPQVIMDYSQESFTTSAVPSAKRLFPFLLTTLQARDICLNVLSAEPRLLFLLLITTIGVNAQTAKTTPTVKLNKHEQKVDSLLSKIDTLLMINNQLLDHLDINSSLKGRYKLYQTDNIYTFLQLDTKTGMIEQVQWSLDSDNEGSVTINSDDLTYGYGYGSGSFELYPTKNMYQFILIDKTSGKKWHVQWGMESSKRWIRRIY